MTQPNLQYQDVPNSLRRVLSRDGLSRDLTVKLGALSDMRIRNLGSVSDVLKESPIFFGLNAIAIGVATYHGYKRNNSIGWAIGWALCATVAPLITVPIALAQGYGQRA